MSSFRARRLATVTGTAVVAGASVAALAFAGPSSHVAAPEDGVYAFTDVTVLPMDGDERTLPGHTVIVRDGVIETVGPSGSVSVPDDAARIDGQGRYLMPGLAEMHAHVPPVPGGNRPPQDVLDDILFLYVANGVTTIRGMLGSPYQLDLARELEQGEHLGPTFYVGAPSINGNSAPTPEAAERMVRAHAEAGYDLQKIHPGVSRATWDRMVAVAKEVGLPWGGHVPADVGLAHALRTGMTTVDHLDGYMEGASGESNPAAIVENLDRGHMQELAFFTRDLDVYVVPTMYLWENLYGLRTADDALADPEMRYVSSQQRQAWRNQAAGRPAIDPAVRDAFLEARREMLGMLAEVGAPILMGTDSPQLFNVPGFALHRELDVMEASGMSRYAILESGTRTVGRYAQEVLGEDEPFGSVAEGHRADLVLLDADPLADLDNLTRRAGVMVRGRWVPRDEIDRGLEALARKHAGG